MLGFEAFEATGLYQVSKAYESNTNAFAVESFGFVPAVGGPLPAPQVNFTASDISSLIAPETNNGVKVTYEDGTQFFGLSLQDGGIFGDNRLGGDSAANNANQGLVTAITGSLGDKPEISGYAVEAAYARDLGNGFNVFVGALMEETESDQSMITSRIRRNICRHYSPQWLRHLRNRCLVICC